MILAAVIDKLKAGVAELKSVEGAAEFLAIETAPPKHKQPGAFVIATQDSARPPSVAAGGYRQELTLGIAVVLALGNFKDRRGASASQQMEALEATVRDTLAGWTPEGTRSQLAYAGAVPIGLRDRVYWRQHNFSTVHYIRK